MNKQLFIYPINVEPMKEGGYFAECSMLQGCHAEGDTFAEAISNIQDVIKTHLECRLEHGEMMPHMIIQKPEAIRLNLPLPVTV